MAIKTELIDKIEVGHNVAEIYFRLGELLVILPPSSAKSLFNELAKLKLPDDKTAIRKPKKVDTIAKQVLRSLYKGKQVTKSLIAVNTKRRKKLPDN